MIRPAYRPRSLGVFILLFAAFPTLAGGASSLPSAPGPDGIPFLAVAVDVDGKMNIYRFSTCEAPCLRIMQMDDVESQTSMIIRVVASKAGLGSFVIVDHEQKSIQVVDFSHAVLVDQILTATGTFTYTGFKLEPTGLSQACEIGKQAGEPLWDALFSKADASEASTGIDPCQQLMKIAPDTSQLSRNLTPTGATKTVDLLVNDELIEVEAREYAFQNDYETDMLPLLSQVQGDQYSQGKGPNPFGPETGIGDMKIVMRSEGTTWVAPAAPGAVQVADFFMAMAVALKTLTNQMAQGWEGTPGAFNQGGNMTAAMTDMMARIAWLGMPVETTTKISITPAIGKSAAGALDLISFMPDNLFPTFSSTSEVLAVVGDVVDFEEDLPEWAYLGFFPDQWEKPGKNGMGYVVTHSSVPQLDP